MDFDECITENEEKLLSKGYVSCGHGAFCANNIGGYACLCRHGFRTGLQGKCVDIDECSKQNVCQENAECRNSQGSYSCDCMDGYEGDLCIDIDECEDRTKCNAKAECQNNDGNYTCQCVEGYFGNGYVYCVRGSCNDDLCPNNQRCVSPRTEECECRDGFHFNGTSNCVGLTTETKLITSQETRFTTTTKTAEQTILTTTEGTETTITTTKQSTSAPNIQE